MDRPGLRAITFAFWRIGWLSFGGPAGQIALMHRMLVEERGWIAEDTFLRALNVCHLLPGPEAQQLATYVGWRLHGLAGGLASGLLFVLPGAAVMLALTLLYAAAADLGWFAALFLGVKAAVLAIILQALLRIGGRALPSGLQRAIALIAFLALALFDAPFPLVVLLAGLAGFVVAGRAPAALALIPVPEGGNPPAGAREMARQTGLTIAAWVAIWAAPMLLVAATLGTGHVLFDIGAFFSRLAVVTFGGAYAVLGYMAQEAVNGFGWLAPGEMADGLGLAETTPGPLILVTQFVGSLAAMRDPAPFTPLVAALLGGGLTLWVTFAPCFLWIFALAPWIERLEGARRLQGALAAITAAVVGVIADLALWFAMHVLFARVAPPGDGLLRLELPVPASLQWDAALLALLGMALVFPLRRSIPMTLAICAAASLGLWALTTG